jgi:hypothetical protein
VRDRRGASSGHLADINASSLRPPARTFLVRGDARFPGNGKPIPEGGNAAASAA